MIQVKKLLPLLFLLLFLSGCAVDTPSIGTPRRRGFDVTPNDTVTETDKPVPYSVLFTQAGATLSQHEPVEGAYVGAWLTQENPHITPRGFGNLAEKSHAIFVTEMTLGDALPIECILHAMSAEAAPLFYLFPNAKKNNPGFEIEQLITLARELSLYDIPMFMAFYPPEENQTREDYIYTFRLARVIFRTYAPKIAFVWVVPEGMTAAPSHPFYPGHDVVDWVGLPVLAKRSRDGLDMDILSAIEPVHQNFQRHKPIMLLPVGISHFSRIDYIYYINETATEIESLYKNIKSFPRIKAVVYLDASNIGLRWDNMSLTRENNLMISYANAITNGHYLSNIEPRPPSIYQWLRSAFHGYFYENRLYVDAETLTAELSVSRPGITTEINNRQYIDISRLTLDISVNHERKIIYIHLPS
jgi:hypothetical protein